MKMTFGEKLGNTGTFITTVSSLSAITLGLQNNSPELSFIGVIGLGLMFTTVAVAIQLEEEVKASK